MKHTSLFYSLLVIASFGINLCSAEPFKWQRGNPEHLEQLRQTGECNNCDLRDFNLQSAIRSYRINYYNAKQCQRPTMNTKIQLQNARLEGADLQDTDLTEANLKNSILWDVDLENANLENADLTNAEFWMASLRNVNLKNANLEHANFKSADLENADFTNANLNHSNIEYANFKGAILTGASLQHLKRAEKAFNLFSEK